MNKIKEALKLDATSRHEIAYLREVADCLNDHLNMERFTVSSDGECYDGKGNIVDPSRFLSALQAAKKELERSNERAEWLLSLWECHGL